MFSLRSITTSRALGNPFRAKFARYTAFFTGKDKTGGDISNQNLYYLVIRPLLCVLESGNLTRNPDFFYIRYAAKPHFRLKLVFKYSNYRIRLVEV